MTLSEMPAAASFFTSSLVTWADRASGMPTRSARVQFIIFMRIVSLRATYIIRINRNNVTETSGFFQGSSSPVGTQGGETTDEPFVSLYTSKSRKHDGSGGLA